MAWTVHDALKTYLAGSGSLDAAFTGGTIEFYTVTAGLLVTCPVLDVVDSGDSVTLSFTAALAVVGAVNATADNARIQLSTGGDGLSTDSVGESGADINFDRVSGWDAGDSISPGNCTVTLTGLTAT